jgi:predicted transcriptional regulator
MERFLQKMDLAVFLALVAGCSKVGEIVGHSGHSAFRVREALKRLQEEGLVERPDYRSWQLAEEGHEVINSLWICYVELFSERPEAHEMIASTIAEAHKMIASDSRHNDETHEMIVSALPLCMLMIMYVWMMRIPYGIRWRILFRIRCGIRWKKS